MMDRSNSGVMEVTEGEVVRRSVGFAPEYEYVAEVTVKTPKGFLTTRDGSFTPSGALMRATAKAKERFSFAGFRRVVGFGGGSYNFDRSPGPKMAVGFA